MLHASVERLFGFTFLTALHCKHSCFRDLQVACSPAGEPVLLQCVARFDKYRNVEFLCQTSGTFQRSQEWEFGSVLVWWSLLTYLEFQCGHRLQSLLDVLLFPGFSLNVCWWFLWSKFQITPKFFSGEWEEHTDWSVVFSGYFSQFIIYFFFCETKFRKHLVQENLMKSLAWVAKHLQFRNSQVDSLPSAGGMWWANSRASK